MRMERTSSSQRQNSLGSAQESKKAVFEGKVKSHSHSIQRMLSRGVLFALVALFCGSVKAELPPGSYEKLRSEAEEVLKIRVTSLGPKSFDGDTTSRYTVAAKVLTVLHSKSGLRRGDTIRFESYVTPRDAQLSGPAQPPLLMKNWTGRIYLNSPPDVKRRGLRLRAWKRKSVETGEQPVFQLAAYGHSFQAGPINWAIRSHRNPTSDQIRRSLP